MKAPVYFRATDIAKIAKRPLQDVYNTISRHKIEPSSMEGKRTKVYDKDVTKAVVTLLCTKIFTAGLKKKIKGIDDRYKTKRTRKKTAPVFK